MTSEVDKLTKFLDLIHMIFYNVNSDLNMTIICLKVNFLTVSQLEPWSREIH